MFSLRARRWRVEMHSGGWAPGGSSWRPPFSRQERMQPRLRQVGDPSAVSELDLWINSVEVDVPNNSVMVGVRALRPGTHRRYSIEIQAASLMTFGGVAIGRNEGERLKRCLRSLSKRASPVVYVDSGSIDGSVQWARDF